MAAQRSGFFTSGSLPMGTPPLLAWRGGQHCHFCRGFGVGRPLSGRCGRFAHECVNFRLRIRGWREKSWEDRRPSCLCARGRYTVARIGRDLLRTNTDIAGHSRSMPATSLREEGKRSFLRRQAWRMGYPAAHTVWSCHPGGTAHLRTHCVLLAIAAATSGPAR